MTRVVQPTSGAIRAANRARIVDLLRRHGSATRGELVRRTALSRATVSSLVGELVGEGLLSQHAVEGTGLGRPPVVLSLNRSAGLAIAVDVGVRHVAVAVGDLSRSVLAERWTALPRGHRAADGTSIVIGSIEDALREADVESERLVGAAISIAAPVARDSGHLLAPGVLPGWNGSELAVQVGRCWGIPVALDNDANLGALGEAASRPGSDESTLLYVKVASRVGLGICLGGRPYRGRDGYAGELGHVSVEPDGERCWCGRRGCLELSAGGDGMIAHLRATGVSVASIGRLVQLVRTQRAEALEVVERGARVLARGLANVALVLDPSVVVLGGELTVLGDRLLDPVRAELASIPFGTPIEVSASALGERASLMGALALVLSESGHFVDRSREVSARAPAFDPRPSLGRATQLVHHA